MDNHLAGPNGGNQGLTERFGLYMLAENFNLDPDEAGNGCASDRWSRAA